MTKRVEIIFGKDGSVRREVFGVKGPACLELTSFLDNFLGKPVETKLKDSYDEVEVEVEESETIVNGLPSGWCG